MSAKKKNKNTTPRRARKVASIAAKVKPSDLLQMTEDQVGIALANVRREIRNAKDANLKSLQDLRSELNKRLNEFVGLHLKDIDKDPEIKAAINDLNLLTLEVQKAVREMQTVKKAIKKATEVISHVDQFLGLVMKVAGFVL